MRPTNKVRETTLLFVGTVLGVLITGIYGSAMGSYLGEPFWFTFIGLAVAGAAALFVGPRLRRNSEAAA